MKENVKTVCLGFIKLSEFIGNLFVAGYNVILPRKIYKSVADFCLKRLLPYTLMFIAYMYAIIAITKGWQMTLENIAIISYLMIVPDTLFFFIMTVGIVQSLRVLNYNDSNDKYEWLTHTRFEE